MLYSKQEFTHKIKKRLRYLVTRRGICSKQEIGWRWNLVWIFFKNIKVICLMTLTWYYETRKQYNCYVPNHCRCHVNYTCDVLKWRREKRDEKWYFTFKLREKGIKTRIATSHLVFLHVHFTCQDNYPWVHESWLAWSYLIWIVV